MMDLQRQNKDLSNTDERVKVILSSQGFAQAFAGNSVSQKEEPEKDKSVNPPKLLIEPGLPTPIELTTEQLFDVQSEAPDQLMSLEGKLNRQLG